MPDQTQDFAYMYRVEKAKFKYGSPGLPVYGYDLCVFCKDGSECEPNEEGIATVVPPLPPGSLSTVWGPDKCFASTYFALFTEPLVYSPYDWAIKIVDDSLGPVVSLGCGFFVSGLPKTCSRKMLYRSLQVLAS